MIFEDEASFRQDATLHSTWSRRGCQPLIPVTGQRKSVKIFGCIDMFATRFLYYRDEVFHAQTYLVFLEQIARKYHRRKVHFIQDNAPYHKDRDVWVWFRDNRKWLEVHNLPPYSPELNAQEPLWKYTRKNGTHNKCFKSQEEIYDTLVRVFTEMQTHPIRIKGYLQPFL